MTDITEEVQSERAQIKEQERELNIKKIQLAIKELYLLFEDGQVENIGIIDDLVILSTANRLQDQVEIIRRATFPSGDALTKEKGYEIGEKLLKASLESYV